MPVGVTAGIRADIEAHLEVLRAEVRQLEAALAALDGDGSAGAGRSRTRRSNVAARASGKRGSARSSKTKRTPSGRAPRGQNQDRILAALAKNPEAKPKAISEATGIPRATVATTMTKLRKAGQIPARRS